MRLISITLLLALCCSCHSGKNMIACKAVDMETQDSIAPRSYVLPKGRVCYVATPSYDYTYPDMNILKRTSYADFTYTDKNMKFMGSSSSAAKMDSLIESQYLVTSALQTAFKRGDTKGGKVYIGGTEYRSSDNGLDVQQITNDYRPDVWIDLSAFSIRVSGGMQSGSSSYNVPFVVMINAPYQAGGGVGSSSGKIVMEYTALWKITDARTKGVKEVKLEGTMKRRFYSEDELVLYLNECAVQAGTDFSNLIAR